jgi:tetratricopeptide (TPR) repeat protein
MSLLRLTLLALVLAFSSSAWCQQGSAPPADQDAKNAQSLAEGVRLLRATRLAEAIDYFDQVASSYENRFKDNGIQFFSARTTTESLMYLVEVANADKGGAKVVSFNWAYAYYLKGYALLDLNRIPEAKSMLQQALELSPRNSQFLSELGHIHQLERNWQSALREFQLAEAAAKEFSPENVRDAELSRAWRGMGYVFVELKRYDDAEDMYRRCLELNKNDTAATNELRHLQSVKPRTIIQ